MVYYLKRFPQDASLPEYLPIDFSSVVSCSCEEGFETQPDNDKLCNDVDECQQVII